MTSHRVFFKNAAWQYVLQGVKFILPLVTLPYLARVLMPEGYALYTYVLALMAYAQVIVEFGFNLSGTRRIANSIEAQSVNIVIGTITMARIVLSVMVFVPVFAFAVLAPITREHLVYTVLSYLAVCGRVLAPDFVFQGREAMGPITTRYLVSKGTSTLLTFVVVGSVEDLLWIPILDIFASLIALIWSFCALNRIFSYRLARTSWQAVIDEVKSSAVYCFSNVAAVTLTGFTTLMIGVVLENRVELAYWSLAITAVSAIQAMYAPVVNSLYPHMVVKGDFGFAKRICLYALPIISTLTVLFALSSKLLIAVIGGPEYLAGAYVIVLVAPLLPLSFYALIFGWPVLGASGMVRQLTLTTIGAAGFCVAALMCLALLHRASIWSVCIVRDLSEFVLFASRMTMVLRLRRTLREPVH